jgi:MFS family permease
VGVRGVIYGISLALGPVLGGALVSAAGWRSIFWVNVPIGAIAILLAVRYIPESRAPRPRRSDPAGQVLVAVLLVTLTYGIIEGPGQGWDSPPVIACFAAAAVSAAGLVRSESRRSEPLIDLRFFRSVPFSSASAIAVLAFGAFGGVLFLNTLYLQDVRLLPPLHAGLETLPLAVMVMAGSLVSGRVVASRGPRPALIASGTSSVIGCAVLAGMTGTTAYPQLLTGYILFGFGFGLVNTSVTNTAVSGMPRAQAGVASAIASSSRQLGQTLGVAVTGAIVAGSAGGPPHAGFIAASHAAWWALTACSGLVLLLGFLATTRRAAESAQQVAAALNPEALTGHNH